MPYQVVFSVRSDVLELELQSDTRDRIYTHARKEYPNECCGAILTDGTIMEFTNVQEANSIDDSSESPRDASTAYLVDSNNLIEVDKKYSQGMLKVLYHSHPNAKAYFSEKDISDAMWDERPNFPDVIYVVISLYGKMEDDKRDLKAFTWNENNKEFVPVTINIVGGA